MQAPPLPERKGTKETEEVNEQGHTEVQNEIVASKFEGLELDSSPETLSLLLYKRQNEAYSMPIMNEVSEIFAIKSLSTELISSYIQEIVDKDENVEEHQLWIDFAKGEHVSYAKLEATLVNGIPAPYRGVAYLKQLQVRFQLTKERYLNLLNKSSFAELPYEQEINQIKDERVKNGLHVFNYYNRKMVNGHSQKLDLINSTNELNTNEADEIFEFVIKISKNFDKLALQELEMLYLIVKFNKILMNVNMDELYYEISRALEDLVPDMFVHITKQGINILEVVKAQVKRFFEQELTSVLDFIVFQGFVFLARVFVPLYKNAPVLEFNGDELQQLLLSEEFVEFHTSTTIEEVLKVDPSIIKYENEYYLLHINSLSNNNYELMNSKEIHQDLSSQIKKLNAEIDNLRTTHEEIIQQSKEFETDIEQEEKKNVQLSNEYNELKSKFDRLTMKENLDNTIKANKVFDSRNEELEVQISLLKKSIESKSEKLAKYT